MIGQYPPMLKKAAILLLIGVVVLGCSLVFNSPISYLVTIGVGSFGLFLAIVGYLIWFFKQLKEPN